MTTTIRFPFPGTAPNHPSEANQIITILPATATLLLGGAVAYADVSAWKTAGQTTEAPYTSVVIEFFANDDFILGNGTTQRIGLYGEIIHPAYPSGQRKFLIGVLGINLGATAPQVPIVQRADAELVGFAQIVCDVAAYDRLSVGGVSGDIGTGDPLVTVRARPIRMRDYMG